MEMLKSYSISKNKSQITNIAIGGFDGMHLGHQELFKKLDSNGAIVVIQTPYENLTPKTTRAKYTSLSLYYYDLNSIKNLSAKDFIRLLNEEFINLEKIVVGFDFKFGLGASGNIDTLKELFDGDIVIVKEFSYNNISVHSSVIRDFISVGDIPMANKLLNKDYTIEGYMIQGQGLGAKQFVPTINIDVNSYLYPALGVYATYTKIDNIDYKSATFIGHRITTNGTFAIETHIINQDITIKNSHISIRFIDKIRDNKKFDKYKDLKKQILEDIILIDKKY